MYFIAIIALMMEAANTSEASVNFYQTKRHNIADDSHLHIRHPENLNSHNFTDDCRKYEC
jgi:hypothetical protein